MDIELKKIPNLFVIGAPKSGTTSFVESLRQHPDIFVPTNKEPRFFDAHVFYDYQEDYPIKNIDKYLSLYACPEASQKQYRVDGSVFNMYSTDSIRAILKMNPEAKFILILRDPVEATKSMHKQRMKYLDKSMREISFDLSVCWEQLGNRKIGKGYPSKCRNRFLFRYDELFDYNKYVSQLLNIVDNENLMIIDYNYYKFEFDDVMQYVCKFLKINDSIKFVNETANPSIMASNNKLNSFFYNKISKPTLGIRKRLGLTGKNVNTIRKYIYTSSQEAQICTRELENKIFAYFEDSISYKNSLLCNRELTKGLCKYYRETISYD